MEEMFNMNTFTIVSLQLELSGSDNMDYVLDEINAVKKRFPQAKMVLLGELALFGPDLQNNISHQSTALNKLQRCALDNHLWLVPGSSFESHQNLTYNVAHVINPQGECVVSHRKLFPFMPYEQNVASGGEFVVFDVPEFGRFGVCICYDMWFPEVIRSLMSMGAEVILHPTMTNTIDRDIELSIARANAAMNQCYLLDVNVAGHYGVGRSIVCGPGGEVIHQAGNGREIITTDIDFDYIRRVREQGWHSLGQPIKSFRDSHLQFPVYQPGGKHTPFLSSLGALKKAEV